MQIKIKNELLPLNISVALLIILITYLPSNILRVFFGLPIVFFFPGYCFTALLAPGNEDLNLLERVALSFGLSIVAFPLVEFFFHFTPWGITLYTSLLSRTIFILIFSVGAWYRRIRLPAEDRFAITYNFQLLEKWKDTNNLDRGLNIFLAISIIFATGSLGYIMLFPEKGEKFTEFYILGRYGRLADYSQEAEVGSIIRVRVGIMNYELERVNYQVEVRIRGEKVSESWSVTLNDGEKMEREMDFFAPNIGKEKVEFLLYRSGIPEPYRSVYFWQDVKGKDENFTEFYANIEPSELIAEKTAKIRVAIVNHEGEAVKYKLYLLESWIAHTRPVSEYDIIEISDGEEWDGEVSTFLNFDPRYQQTVDVQLWRVGEEAPYKVVILRFFAKSK